MVERNLFDCKQYRRKFNLEYWDSQIDTLRDFIAVVRLVRSVDELWLVDERPSFDNQILRSYAFYSLKGCVFWFRLFGVRNVKRIKIGNNGELNSKRAAN